MFIRGSSAVLAYRRSGKIYRENLRSVRRFAYKGKTGDVLSIPEGQVHGQKGDSEGFLFIDSPSQVTVIYNLSNGMTLSDAQVAT